MGNKTTAEERKNNKLKEFTLKAKERFGDLYTYENAIYAGVHKKLLITCQEHGDVETTPINFLKSKCGCSKCAGNNLTQEEFIRKCIKIHGEKYDYSKVIYTKAINKITIICPIHGEFIKQASEHSNGDGCQKCNFEKSRLKQMDTLEEFIEKGNKRHDFKYDYSKVVYNGSKNSVIIGCPIHGFFKQTPNNHLRTSGCPECGDELVWIKRGKDDNKSIIERARAVHGNKYDYSKMDFTYMLENVIITCPDHGDFEQTPANHISNKNGCPKCSTERNSKLKSISEEEFLERATEKHGNKYDYSKMKYVDIKTPIEIICNIHGLFTKAGKPTGLQPVG